MSVKDTDVIDASAIDDSSNTLVLLIIDQQPWISVEAEHIKLLQEKLRNYVRYIDSKGWLSVYRNRIFSGTRIEIKFRYQYPPAFEQYLDFYKDKLNDRNITVTCEVVSLERNV